MFNLSSSIKFKIIEEKNDFGIFEITGLYTGYGLTLSNALRRVLLSSLSGAAITNIKIKGVQHEFSTIPGMKEDVIQLILNLKKIKIRMLSKEPQTLKLSVKGEKKITAGDFEKNSNVEIVDPKAIVANLTDKKASLEMEIVVESGLGYVPSEMRRNEKLPIGSISLDAAFSPVERVKCDVEDMRVGERTDYNKIRLQIETNGTVAPQLALKRAIKILMNHIQVIDEKIDIKDPDLIEEIKE